jgi:hypothetical protein
VQDIVIYGMPSLNCFLLLGGTASAGAHDVKEASEEDCLDVRIVHDGRLTLFNGHLTPVQGISN